MNDKQKLFLELTSKNWWELFAIAEVLVEKLSQKQLHDKLLEIFPPIQNQETLAIHYQSRLKRQGKTALIEQMCSNSLRRLICNLQNENTATDIGQLSEPNQK